MAERLVLACPSKINLRLRVGEPDARGYHPLDTEFQAVGLFDELELTVGEEGFAVEGASLPAENTVVKALRLVREAVKLPPLRITLRKCIPAQAGLGGGSSDAAGLLRAAMLLAPGAELRRAALDIARAVGADVPFFLVGGRARGRGYGDEVDPLPDAPTRWLVLAAPTLGAATERMYAALDAARAAGAAPPPEASGTNDFELVAPAASLRLMRALRERGLGPVALCGSGSAVYGFAEDEAQARAAARELAEEGEASAFAAPTLARGASFPRVLG